MIIDRQSLLGGIWAWVMAGAAERLALEAHGVLRLNRVVPSCILLLHPIRAPDQLLRLFGPCLDWLLIADLGIGKD